MKRLDELMKLTPLEYHCEYYRYHGKDKTFMFYTFDNETREYSNWKGTYKDLEECSEYNEYRYSGYHTLTAHPIFIKKEVDYLKAAREVCI